VTRSHAPITRPILQAIVRLDDPTQPYAEIARRVAADAEALGLTRPSYERLRQLIKEHRAARDLGPSALELWLTNGFMVTRAFIDEVAKPRDERRRWR
jgi:hypothetical protein